MITEHDPVIEQIQEARADQFPVIQEFIDNSKIRQPNAMIDRLNQDMKREFENDN